MDNTKQTSAIQNARLRPGGIKELTGITYRQIHTWDSKGVLPTSRETDASWREFSGASLIILKIMSELTELGIPIGKQRQLYHWMNNEEWLTRAIQIYRRRPAYVYTDFESSRLLSEEELEEYITISNKAAILIKLDPILQACFLGLSLEDPRVGGDGEDVYRKNRKGIGKISQLLHQHSHQIIRILVRDGKIVDVKSEIDRKN